MEQDGMQHAGLAGEGGGAAIVFQHDAGIGEQRAIRQMLAMPIGQGGERLGDDEGGAFLFQLGGGGGERVAEAEADEPEFRLAGGPERGAGEAGEFLFGGAGGGAADLLAMDEQGFAAIMLLKGERAAVGKLGFCESDSWFHGAWGLRCWNGFIR